MKTCLICQREAPGEQCDKPLAACAEHKGNDEMRVMPGLPAEMAEKIKGSAKSVFWTGAALCIAAGMILLVLNETTRGIGLAMLMPGPLLAWLASLILYSLGSWMERIPSSHTSGINPKRKKNN